MFRVVEMGPRLVQTITLDMSFKQGLHSLEDLIQLP